VVERTNYYLTMLESRRQGMDQCLHDRFEESKSYLIFNSVFEEAAASSPASSRLVAELHTRTRANALYLSAYLRRHHPQMLFVVYSDLTPSRELLESE